jgi:hypothetical protein
LKKRNNEKDNANNVIVENGGNNYIFIAMNDGFNAINMCKWVIDSKTRQHMTPHRKTFDTYKSIDVRKKIHEK